MSRVEFGPGDLFIDGVLFGRVGKISFEQSEKHTVVMPVEMWESLGRHPSVQTHLTEHPPTSKQLADTEVVIDREHGVVTISAPIAGHLETHYRNLFLHPKPRGEAQWKREKRGRGGR